MPLPCQKHLSNGLLKSMFVLNLVSTFACGCTGIILTRLRMFIDFPKKPIVFPFLAQKLQMTCICV